MRPNLLKIYTKVKSQEILAEGYDKSDIPQIFELLKSPDDPSRQLAMQMLYGKSEDGTPNFDNLDIENYAQHLFGSLPVAAWKKWTDLLFIETLDLFNRFLTEIPEGIRWMVNLHTLNLSKNYISTIKANAFNGLQKLHSITIWDNPLKQISDKAFDGLPNLQLVHIGYDSALQEQIENLRKKLPNVKIIF